MGVVRRHDSIKRSLSKADRQSLSYNKSPLAAFTASQSNAGGESSQSGVSSCYARSESGITMCLARYLYSIHLFIDSLCYIQTTKTASIVYISETVSNQGNLRTCADHWIQVQLRTESEERRGFNDRHNNSNFPRATSLPLSLPLPNFQPYPLGAYPQLGIHVLFMVLERAVNCSSASLRLHLAPQEVEIIHRGRFYVFNMWSLSLFIALHGEDCIHFMRISG